MIRIKAYGDQHLINQMKDILGKDNEIKFVIKGKHDISYCIFAGFYPKTAKAILKLNKPLIFHWIGTDVLDVTSNNKSIWKLFQRTLIKKRAKMKNTFSFTCAPWLVNELQKINIHSKYVPITTIDHEKLKTKKNKIKRTIDIMSYIPERSFEFYGGTTICKIANKNPNFKITIIMGDVTEEEKFDKIRQDKQIPKNITLKARMNFDELKKVYLESKIFLRIPEHDGLSLSVLEAMYYGCQVIWKYQIPYTIKFNETNSSEQLNKLIKNWKVNTEGKKYIIKTFNGEIWKKQFKEEIKKIIKKIK